MKFKKKYPENVSIDDEVIESVLHDQEGNTPEAREREMKRIIRNAEEVMQCVYAGPEYFEGRFKDDKGKA